MSHWIRTAINRYMTINEIFSDGFSGIVYHCSDHKFDTFNTSNNRGAYFANEPDHDYGKYIYKCLVTLRNPSVGLSTGRNLEIDRNFLINLGYDGRIVDYREEVDDGEEMYDVIAFYPTQIKILDITEQ